MTPVDTIAVIFRNEYHCRPCREHWHSDDNAHSIRGTCPVCNRFIWPEHHEAPRDTEEPNEP